MPKLSLTLAVFALLGPVAAHADTYNFTISTGTSQSGVPGTVFQANGTLTGSASSSVPSALNLTGVTGSAEGYSFAGIAPLGLSTGFSYDNLLYTSPNAAHVDATGILLDMVNLSNPVGTSLAHVYDNGQYHVDVFDPGDPGDITPFTIDSFNLQPIPTVPEPSTLALMGTGALGMLRALRHRRSR